MNYQKNYFQPRRPVKSFQDLEVYQKLLGVSVVVVKRINSSPSSRPASAVIANDSSSLRGSDSDRGNPAGNEIASSSAGWRTPRNDRKAKGLAMTEGAGRRNDVVKELVSKLTDHLLALPVMIASAHSLRFSDHDEAVKKLDDAMLGCNLAVVYLEQFRDLGQTDIETAFFDEQIKTLLTTRGKVLHLQMSWKKFFPTGDKKEIK